MLFFLKVQWVFGPLAEPLNSATHDVLLNIVEVAVDHITNLFGQQGFGSEWMSDLASLSYGLVRSPLHYNFTCITGRHLAYNVKPLKNRDGRSASTYPTSRSMRRYNDELFPWIMSLTSRWHFTANPALLSEGPVGLWSTCSTTRFCHP